MSYGEFGLDANKRSKDPDELVGEFYDPWSWEHVRGRHFYLCFSNWVLSRSTMVAFLAQKPVDPLPGDSCFKCRATDRPLHYDIAGKEMGGTPTGICHSCVEWANEYLSKPEPPPPPGTQFKLF